MQSCWCGGKPGPHDDIEMFLVGVGGNNGVREYHSDRPWEQYEPSDIYRGRPLTIHIE